jgi:glycosyltransferase involved in cell wall biosynthesis
VAGALERQVTAAIHRITHIAFVLPNLAGGGAERVALHIARRLVELGHRVDFVLMEATGQLLERLPPEIRVVDLKAARIRNAVCPLVRYLRCERPDVIQARMWPVTIAAIVAKLIARSSARLIVSDHTQLSLHYGGSRSAMHALKWSVRLFYPLADVRVVVSHGAAADLARLSGVSLDQFQVIYNPLPQTEVNPELASEPAWGGVGDRIIAIGNLKAEKNHKLLIDAFARLRRGREARLMIVGEGALREELLELAEQLGVAEDVVLSGFVLDPQRLLTSADLFVLSSDYEGFGNVLIEAMHAGVPVVSTDCPSGPAEILQGGKYGPLVPCNDPASLADAMKTALQSPVSGHVLRSRAEEISGSAAIDRYVALLTNGTSK